jgi:hypothetical protein
MRRDLIIGFRFHDHARGADRVGRRPHALQAKPKVKEEEPTIQISMPKIEPDEPDVVEDQPQTPQDISPRCRTTCPRS